MKEILTIKLKHGELVISQDPDYPDKLFMTTDSGPFTFGIWLSRTDAVRLFDCIDAWLKG